MGVYTDTTFAALEKAVMSESTSVSSKGGGTVAWVTWGAGLGGMTSPVHINNYSRGPIVPEMSVMSVYALSYKFLTVVSWCLNSGNRQ